MLTGMAMEMDVHWERIFATLIRASTQTMDVIHQAPARQEALVAVVEAEGVVEERRAISAAWIGNAATLENAQMEFKQGNVNL